MQPADYLKLPYHRVIQPDQGGYWSARVVELDGVFSEGKAAENLNIAMELWIGHEPAEGARDSEPLGCQLEPAVTPPPPGGGRP